MNNNYNINTVQKLEFFDAVRKYPGMYIGSKDLQGLHHLAKEIISNSIDEYLNGGCSQIKITINKDSSLTVEDNGRGIPIGTKEDGKTALELCFTEEHAGGKFLNITGESGYNSAGGMHGLGAKCVNALSDKMYITNIREGQQEYIEFKAGKKISHKTIPSTASSGLKVQFYPSSSYLEVTKFDSAKLKTLIQEFSFLCKGLEFIFSDQILNIEETFLSSNGLFDYLNYLNNDNYLTDAFYFTEQEGNFQLEVAFAYSNNYTSITKLFTNNIPQEKGTHLTGFKSAFTASMNIFAREKKWLKEKDNNLTGADFEEGQILILNFKMIDPVFKGQNKEELSSSEGRTYVQKFALKSLPILFEKNEKEIKKIVDKALSARKAREAAKKARDAVRAPKEKGLKAKLKLSNKFTDCITKDPKERNLLLVEGNSAAASAIEARNTKTDCIYMLRGKIISPLKTEISKILQNQEMSDLIQIIGAGFGDNFDINKMNFDKIIITSDQDSDGLDIELLLMTFFYTYMRPLVEAGKLYRAVTPLYIIRKGKEEFYLYSEEEMDSWKKAGKGGDILRAKGLGELNPEDLQKVCFLNERYKRITVSDIQATGALLEILQGPSVEPRKKFIYENAKQLGFNFD